MENQHKCNAKAQSYCVCLDYNASILVFDTPCQRPQVGRNALVMVSKEMSDRASSMNDSVNMNGSDWSVVNCCRSG